MRANLFAIGRVPWGEARRLLIGMTCAWADLDGWHQTEPSDQPPIATHLWAWGDERWARVRVDGEDAVVAILTTAMLSLPGAEFVEVDIEDGPLLLIDPEDDRIPLTSKEWLGGEARVLNVLGPQPLAFIERRRQRERPAD